MRKYLSIILTIVLVLTLFSFTAFAEGPFTLEAPKNLTAELKFDQDGVPYFELDLDIPQSVIDINSNILEGGSNYPGYMTEQVVIEFEYKYGNYDWNEGPSLYWDTSAYVEDFDSYEYRPFDEGGWDTIDIKAETYHFRARFSSMWGYEDDWLDKYIYSNYSNTVTIGNPSYYENASQWAVTELDKAKEADLIPEILLGKDMTKNITREEFAELAVVLYEKTTGLSVEPDAVNPFVDTTNPQILKALKIGVTQGTSLTTFAPNDLITREQCAAMLFRTIKAIKPDGDFSIEGIKDFPDQKYISEYAVQPTKYMSKIGIIKGDAATGNFMPKANSSVSQATGYGMATREAAILMSVRTYEAIK